MSNIEQDVSELRFRVQANEDKFEQILKNQENMTSKLDLMKDESVLVTPTSAEVLTLLGLEVLKEEDFLPEVLRAFRRSSEISRLDCLAMSP